MHLRLFTLFHRRGCLQSQFNAITSSADLFSQIPKSSHLLAKRFLHKFIIQRSRLLYCAVSLTLNVLFRQQQADMLAIICEQANNVFKICDERCVCDSFLATHLPTTLHVYFPMLMTFEADPCTNSPLLNHTQHIAYQLENTHMDIPSTLTCALREISK